MHGGGGGHVWKGGVHGRGHAWWGACMAGGVCGRGWCVCVAGETATAVGGTHPAGMHSCFLDLFLQDFESGVSRPNLQSMWRGRQFAPFFIPLR